MYPSNRAGLVALVCALFISLVSAFPIPIHTPHSPSTLSWDLIQRDTGVLAQVLLNGPISTLPATTVPTGDPGNTSVDADNQLVRRNARLNAKIRAGFRKMASGIKHIAKKIGNGFKKMARGIKQVAKKIGNGIKKAAKKVGNFIKHTGAIIAKFGLKVLSTVQKVGAKIVRFIPGIGKPLSKALGAVSKATGAISDRIHAHLSKKLQKGMSIMNKVNKVMKFIPRDLSEEEDFWYDS